MDSHWVDRTLRCHGDGIYATNMLAWLKKSSTAAISNEVQQDFHAHCRVTQGILWSVEVYAV